MEIPVNRFSGGIRSLLAELKTCGGAINFDLMAHGWHRRDIGGRMSWNDLRDFLAWLPPTGQSAWFRAKRPNSWWVTPELQFLAAMLYALEGANWQRGGCNGNAPKPHKFPDDHQIGVRDLDDLQSRRQRIKERRTGKGR